VEAAHHEAVAVGIQEGQGEALVAPRVLERVEPDEADAGEGKPQVALQDGRPRLDGIEVADDLVDAREVGLEDRLEAALVAAPGEGGEAALEPADPAGLDDRQDEQQENGDRQAADDRSQVVADDGVEVDGRASRALRFTIDGLCLRV